MKKKIFLISLLFITTFSNAQTPTIVWGDLDKQDKIFEKIFSGLNDEIITLTADVSGNNGILGIGETYVYTPRLTRYDKKMREIKSNAYPLERKDTRWGGVLTTKNLIYLLTNRYNKDTKSTTYFAQAINITTLKKEEEIITFGSFEAVPKTLFSKKSEKRILDSLFLLNKVLGTAI